MSGQAPDNRGPILLLVMLAIAGFIAVAGGLSETSDEMPAPTAPATSPPEPSEQPKKQKERRHKRDKPRPSEQSSSADQAVATAAGKLPVRRKGGDAVPVGATRMVRPPT